MHQEPDMGFDPGSPGSRPGPKAGAKPLRHPGIPLICNLGHNTRAWCPDIPSRATLNAPQALCAPGTQARGCGEGRKCPVTQPSAALWTEGAQTSQVDVHRHW